VTQPVIYNHMGMGMGVNPYLPLDIGDPTRLLFCRGYGCGIVIPSRYLSIAISTRSIGNQSPSRRLMHEVSLGTSRQPISPVVAADWLTRGPATARPHLAAVGHYNRGSGRI
jgi:hypothetical protein